jgi:FkbM family methyltransferase
MGALNTLKNLVPIRARQVLAAYHVLWNGEAEYQILKYLCRPDLVSLDVGANDGLYTYWCLRYSSSVIAFEPSVFCCSRLRRAFPDRVEIRQCAVSSHNGRATLRVPLLDGRREFGLSTLEDANALGGHAFAEITVDTIALDEVVHQQVGFMKIDVEGHELAVLEGASGIIERHHPRLLIECEERHRDGAVGSVRKLLDGYGYRGFQLDRRPWSRRAPTSTPDPEKRRPVHNNFIFCHRGDLEWIRDRTIRLRWCDSD